MAFLSHRVTVVLSSDFEIFPQGWECGLSHWQSVAARTRTYVWSPDPKAGHVAHTCCLSAGKAETAVSWGSLASQSSAPESSRSARDPVSQKTDDSCRVTAEESSGLHMRAQAGNKTLSLPNLLFCWEHTFLCHVLCSEVALKLGLSNVDSGHGSSAHSVGLCAYSCMMPGVRVSCCAGDLTLLF